MYLSSPQRVSALRRAGFGPWAVAALAAVLAAFLAISASLAFTSNAHAATTPPTLGTVGSYSVLGAETVTNTGPTVLSGDLGVSPGTAITGFPPGLVLGTIHAGNAQAGQAQSDLGSAYTDLAGREATASVSADLGGQTFVEGVYSSSGPLGLTGTVTLDAQGDPDAVFIFQAASTLITATSSTVALTNGAQACNVYWQVGSSATLGTNTTFAGSILAQASISVNTGATVEGRALARTGAVTLDSNVFSAPGCETSPPTEDPTEDPTLPPTEDPTTDPPTTDPPETTPPTTDPPTTDPPETTPPTTDDDDTTAPQTPPAQPTTTPRNPHQVLRRPRTKVQQTPQLMVRPMRRPQQSVIRLLMPRRTLRVALVRTLTIPQDLLRGLKGVLIRALPVTLCPPPVSAALWD